ncbi:MAG: AMP-binding protein [Chloroflexi bacterium]|nr:AMP-binding protein [Chloroflexota bacterium]
MAKRYYRPEIETLPREDFLAYQWQMLKAQVEYTYARSGLCRQQFKAAGITPDDIKTRDDFTNRVPFTTKKDLIIDQERQPPYGSRLCVPEGEIHHTYLTSGTSGKGLEVHAITEADYQFLLTVTATIYTWSGWQAGEKVMLPLPLNMNSAAPTHLGGLARLGCDVFNLGMSDTRTKLEYLKRFKITAFFATTAYLETLTSEAEAMGLDPAKDFSVRRILTGIQSYPVSFIHRMARKWNAEIYDYYGTTQWADGATCEKGAAIGDGRGHYHMLDHVAFNEVLNPDTGQPVAPGEVGELVTTPLNRKGSPYLRFRLADKVRLLPADTCDCGRPFSIVEAGTVSRYDDMMKIKGINIWPDTIDHIVFAKDEASEYKGRLYIAADGREKAEINLEFKPGVAAAVKQRLLGKIAAEIQDATEINFILKEATEPLPHSVFKVRRWTDERAKGLEGKGGA